MLFVVQARERADDMIKRMAEPAGPTSSELTPLQRLAAPVLLPTVHLQLVRADGLRHIPEVCPRFKEHPGFACSVQFRQKIFKQRFVIDTERPQRLEVDEYCCSPFGRGMVLTCQCILVALPTLLEYLSAVPFLCNVSASLQAAVSNSEFVISFLLSVCLLK